MKPLCYPFNNIWQEHHSFLLHGNENFIAEQFIAE